MSRLSFPHDSSMEGFDQHCPNLHNLYICSVFSLYTSQVPKVILPKNFSTHFCLISQAMILTLTSFITKNQETSTDLLDNVFSINTKQQNHPILFQRFFLKIAIKSWFNYTDVTLIMLKAQVSSWLHSTFTLKTDTIWFQLRASWLLSSICYTRQYGIEVVPLSINFWA